MAEPNFLLQDIWYFALPGQELKPGTMRAKSLLDQPVLLGRTAAGEVFALRDICPHRGIPLSCGRFDGREVECRYHGWRFDQGGTCTAIPSLVAEQQMDVSRIKVRRYPVREVQGNVWIWMGEGEPAMEPPRVPHFADGRGANMVLSMEFPCFQDHAVIGLMDPAHGPYVHKSWFWRSERTMHEKAKAFGPAPFGFVMKRHRPSSNSAAYKILGGAPETEIRFQLPGIRIEHIQVGRHHVCNLTTVTPLGPMATEVTNQMYWTMGWASAAKPLLRPFAAKFLRQDRDVVVMQQQGLRHDPSLMLIKDADTQARWYYQLKNEWVRAREEGREFRNPVKDVTLRWRS
ncbi:aromatic ring-hydroxylating oxygenase subunit alpha [Indioceanicola profundi]|uniref:aromatic ring-hydroxylating oxygenase subunit alpha n=1 Tax=Indioceanicola profundi TaxID=2220096 RepID=UPI000E6AD378|nr:aromatic ring-hydroxylating dioxygenase subunit alpha [Indioceanicola profundi]